MGKSIIDFYQVVCELACFRISGYLLNTDLYVRRKMFWYEVFCGSYLLFKLIEQFLCVMWCRAVLFCKPRFHELPHLDMFLCFLFPLVVVITV